LEKILKLRCRSHQHLSNSIHTIKVVALARLRHLCPSLKIRELFLGLLRIEVVRQTNRELVRLMKFVHDFVVVGIVLEAAARINRTRDAETIQLAEK